MRNSHRSVVLLLAIGMCLTVCRPAEAYIDGGSGSYLLQILLATAFGASFAIKSTFRNLKAVVVGRRAAKHAPNNDQGA